MKIAIFSSFPPKPCGVGEFTSDLINGLQNIDTNIDISVYAIDNIQQGYEYPSIVKDHFYFQNRKSYSDIAKLVNEGSYELCLIQHEFLLFGGERGEFIFDFVENVKIPIVLVLHSVPLNPDDETFQHYKNHVLRLSPKIQYFVSISDPGRDALIRLGIDPNKIMVITHGAPKLPPLSMSAAYRKKLNLENSFTVLMFGLLRKNKGIEYLFDAVKEIKDKVQKLKCLIIGVPLYPKYEAYVQEIKEYPSKIGIENNVLFIEKYFKREELYSYIISSDIVVTPYLSLIQTSSGPLTFAVAAGVPVISTPYPFAKELLKNIGVLVPYKDSGAIAKAILKLATDKNYYEMQRSKTLELGKTLSWDLKAKEYIDLFKKVVSTS